MADEDRDCVLPYSGCGRRACDRRPAEAADLDEAIEIALELLRTLDMPQRPDGVTITDGDGSTIHSSRLDTIENLDERPPP
ncbi:hypothetical protein [Sinorhizobium sp. BJ1]|uniref:hypothetical protein n=1 Tax=Sinorhizobium sp. BJ1 TaxID=2035455 RepID=UPI0032AF4447